MINLGLFFIGSSCVIISLFIMLKESSDEENKYKSILNEQKKIESRFENIQATIKKLEKLISLISIQNDDENKNFELISKENIVSEHQKNVTKKLITEETRIHYDIKEKVNILKNKGFSNHEIAKKLGKGKREIDIIMKMKDDQSD